VHRVGADAQEDVAFLQPGFLPGEFSIRSLTRAVEPAIGSAAGSISMPEPAGTHFSEAQEIFPHLLRRLDRQRKTPAATLPMLAMSIPTASPAHIQQWRTALHTLHRDIRANVTRGEIALLIANIEAADGPEARVSGRSIGKADGEHRRGDAELP
jgi:hypothetical protein